MLDALKAKVTGYENSQLYLLWGKYYLDCPDVPRDLFKACPQLQQHNNLLKFKPIDKNDFKNKIKLMNTKEECERILVSTFNLSEPITSDKSAFLDQLIGIQTGSLSEKALKSVFGAAIRIFIQIIYQLSQIIDNSIRAKDPKISEQIISLIIFLNNSQVKKTGDFMILLIYFYNSLHTKIPQIFQNSHDTQIMSSWLKLMSIILSCADSDVKLQSNLQIFTYFPSDLILILNSNEFKNWNDKFINTLYTIFMQIGTKIPKCSPNDIINLLESEKSVFNIFLNSNSISIDPSYLFKLGTKYLETFSICLGVIKPSNSIIQRFGSNIYLFIQWVIKTFENPQNYQTNVAKLAPLPELKELSISINLNEYFKHNATVDYTPPKFCPEMTTLLDTLKSIVNNLNDPPSFLTSYVAQILNANISKINNFRVLLPFVCELAFLFDGLIHIIIEKNWTQLFVPQIFPVQPNLAYNAKITDCCLLLLMRFFIYTKDFKVRVLDKIAEYANNNSVAFSYFFKLFNSLLITDSSSGFNIALPNSKSLTLLLIKNAKTNLTYFDFLRQFVNKFPSESFTSNDICQFIVDSYQIPKYSLSTLNLIEKGLCLKKTSNTDQQLTSANNLLSVLSTMMKKKSDKALEIFTLIGQKIMVGDLNPILHKRGDIFDVCSTIAINFPDRLNEVIQLFVQVSKISKDALNILLSPDSNVYSNLSKAMNDKPNDNTLNLLLQLAIQDNSTITNPQALKLVFEKLPGSKIEPVLIDKLSILCKVNDNMAQILNADGPKYIISRVNAIQDETNRNKLLDLYKMICKFSFNVSLFYSTISAIRKPQLAIPNKILNIWNSLLLDDIKTQKERSLVIQVMGSSQCGPTILPLFRKLNGCPKCINADTFCPNCGALDQTEGTNYISLILQILGNLLSASKTFNHTFLSLRLPNILVEFISQVKPIFRNSVTIDQIFEIFKKIQLPQLSFKYVESVCMDFNFISSFNPDFQVHFANKIYDAFSINQKAFADESIIERLLYKVMNDNTDKSSNEKIYSIFVNILTILAPYANSKELIGNFFSILYENSSPMLTDSILNMMKSLISGGNISSMFNDDSFIHAFTPLMAIRMKGIHKQVFDCIMSLTQDNEHVRKPMIQCAVSYNKYTANKLDRTQSTTQIGTPPATKIGLQTSSGGLYKSPLSSENSVNRKSTMVAPLSVEEEDDLQLFRTVTTKLGKLPALLPFWSSLCRNLHSKQDIEIEINKVLALPNLPKIPLWFYWIYTIKQIEPKTLIDLVVTDATNVKLAYDFCDVYEKETGTSMSALKNGLIDKLLNLNIIEPIFLRLAIRMFFRHLYFTEKRETKQTNTSQADSYLSSKIQLYSCKLERDSQFHMDVKQNKWCDLQRAKNVFNKIAQYATSRPIYDLKPIHGIHPLLLLAYIAYTINKFEPIAKSTIETVFGNSLEKADIVTSYKAACILSQMSKDLTFLNPYLDIYADSSDSPEYQLFIFEERVSKIFSKNKFVKIFKQTISESLLVSNSAYTTEDFKSIRAFCSFCDPGFFRPILERLKKFQVDQAQKIQANSINRNRLLTNFMTRLQFGCGPWAITNGQIHFEMLNSVSSNGTHNLMNIVNLLSANAEHILPKNRNSNEVYPATLVDIGGDVIGEITMGKDSILFDGGINNKRPQARTQLVLQANNIAFIFNRSFPSYPNSVEVFMFDYRSFVFHFPSKNAADKKSVDVKNVFLTQASNLIRTSKIFERKTTNEKFNFLRNISSIIPTRVQKDKNTLIEIYQKMKIVERWQQNLLSNYEFIHYLNILIGNSFHVIESYPVFPLVLLSPDGKTVLGLQKYQPLTADDICFILGRVIPYSKRVKPKSILIRDVSELKCGVPELYCFPAFLLNENKGPENVKLPPWAENHANRYVQSMRRALESSTTRSVLSQWLENAFGMSYSLLVPQGRRFSDLEAPITNRKSSIEIQRGIEFTNAQALRIKKQICIFTNGTAVDFRCDKFISFKLPPSLRGTVLSISKNQSCAIFGTKRDPVITILHSIPSNPVCESFALIKQTDRSKMMVMPINSDQQADLLSSLQSSGSQNKGHSKDLPTTLDESNRLSVTCAALIGDRFLLTASDDLLTVWKFRINYLEKQNLVSLEEISTTSFHNDQIVSIAGNAELGLIVSCDKEMNIVFETLFNSIFIRNIKIDQRISKDPPLINVFKSGTVSVVVPSDRSSLLTLYDTRGKIIFRRNIELGKAVETDKIVENFVNERLVIGIEQFGLVIVDLCDLTLKNIPITNSNFTGKFSVISKAKEIIAECNGRLDLFKI